MSDSYWIDIIPTGLQRKGDVVGDYHITGLVGKKWHIDANAEVAGAPRHRHHHHRGGQYWQQPIYYIPDYGDVAVTATQDEYELPDNVQGWDAVGALSPVGFATPGGWSRAARNPLLQWRAKWKSDPPMPIVSLIMGQIREIKGGLARGENLALLHHHMVLDFLINNRRLPTGYPGSGGVFTGENLALVERAKAIVAGEEQRYASSHRGLGGDLVNAFNTVASIAGAPIGLVTSALEQIPLVGPLIHEAVALDPLKAIGGMTAQVLQGERIDRAFLNTAKDQLRHVKEIAPYVQAVMSVVPGIGTGVAAAIAAGTAIAEGRTITDAVIEGLKGAVPGGQLGKAALGAALAITHGDKVSDVVVNAVKTALPPAAQRAVDTAIAAAGGKNVRESVLQAIRANIPKEAQKALDVGVAVGIARNAQSAVTNTLTKPAAQAKLAAKSIPKPFVRQAPVLKEPARGYQVAMGALQHRGVTPHALVALREALPAAQRPGFDHAAKVYKNHFTQLTHSSLVRGGVVTRGNWSKVSANTKGATPGRLVKDGVVTSGHFIRA